MLIKKILDRNVKIKDTQRGWNEKVDMLLTYIGDVFGISRWDSVEYNIFAIEFLFISSKGDLDPDHSMNVDSIFISTYKSARTPRIDFFDELKSSIKFCGFNRMTQIKVWYKDLLFTASYDNENVVSILPVSFKEKYTSKDDELGLDMMSNRFNYHILRHGSNDDVYRFDNEEFKREYEENR